MPYENLTAKQEQFVAEYLVDLNATAAYRRAGYKFKNDNVAGVEAAKLLKNPKVQAAIESAMAKRSERLEITQDRVLQEFAKIAFFDPRNLFHADGTPIPINELDANTAAAIAGLDVQEEFEGSGADRVFVGYTKKYKIADKKGALDSVARHLGMFIDRKEVGKPGDFQDLTEDELDRQIREAEQKVAAAGGSVH